VRGFAVSLLALLLGAGHVLAQSDDMSGMDMGDMPGMDMSSSTGILGPYPMTRDASIS